MAIRAVLWDVDDTIFDYAGSDRTGLLRHLRAEGLPESDEDHHGRWMRIASVHWERVAAGESDWPAHCRDRVREFLDAELSDEDADAWFRRYVGHYESSWELFPDAVPVLDALAATHRHAILSNSSVDHQERKLRALGVRDRFEVLLCAQELGVWKPDARAFRTACEALELDPHEVVYVGDQPDIDAAGAVAAGLAGVWLDRRGRGGRPELVRITGLAELPGLLAGDTRFGAPDTFG
ncbi:MULTISPECIES: HAD family hydrolase [unclassified Streptomyces]|uniref:HAD family hydrolase n=1 Tax=unclassified Streptomyces TaxID=2593676 RepID=UPI0035D7133D